jgi:uncharacterized protein YjbJ (UPF0337 family)
MKNEGISEQLIPNIFFSLRKWESMNSTGDAKTMNWDELEGKWKMYKGQIREKWGKLTDDDIHVIAGKRDQLIGRLQERYGIAMLEAAEQAEAFLKALAEDPKERAKAAAGRR